MVENAYKAKNLFLLAIKKIKEQDWTEEIKQAKVCLFFYCFVNYSIWLKNDKFNLLFSDRNTVICHSSAYLAKFFLQYYAFHYYSLMTYILR